MVELESEERGYNIYVEYLENINVVNLVVTSRHKLREISFYKHGVQLNEKLKVNFENFSIDPKSVTNVKVNINAENTYYEAMYRFKALHFVKPNQTAPKDLKSDNKEVLQLKCYCCDDNLIKHNERFKLLQIPNDELSELGDNFWCHKHDHSHEHGENEDHTHHHEDQIGVDPSNTQFKEVLHNMTLVIVNANHLDKNKIRFQDKYISCSNCQYNIGYTKTHNSVNYNLWKSNVKLNESITSPSYIQYVFNQLQQGRYVFNVRRIPAKKLYIWIITDNLYFIQDAITTNKSVSLTKNCKKLLYNYLNHDSNKATAQYTQFEESINGWKNDINVEYIEISSELYDDLIEHLITSTSNLYESFKLPQNGFYISIV